MKIAALMPTHQHVYDKKKKHRINIKNYFGLKMIINEIKLKLNLQVDIIDFNDIDNYDIILFSQHAISDYYALVFTMVKKYKKKRNNIWIAGGAGISNVNPLIEYFDHIIIGRGEYLIIDLIKSILANKTLIHKSVVNTADYTQKKIYEINYVDQLYPVAIDNFKEEMYGCKYNCLYCRYRYSALPPNLRSKDKQTTMPGNEETFWDLNITSGAFYTTSLDGLTEKIRYKVNKKISNKMVVDKLVQASLTNKKINLKIYFIIGYPEEQILNFTELEHIFKEIDSKITDCKMFINIHFTPFSAEPQTPMQWEQMNIITDWRAMFDKMRLLNKYLYRSNKIDVMFMRTTIKPLELLKRAVFNRAHFYDMNIIKYLGSHTEQITHSKNNTEKLALVLAKYDVSQFVDKKEIGSFLASSNITSWQSDEMIVKQAQTYRSFRGLP